MQETQAAPSFFDLAGILKLWHSERMTDAANFAPICWWRSF